MVDSVDDLRVVGHAAKADFHARSRVTVFTRTRISWIYLVAMRKVLVSFDDDLLRRIDRVASSRGLTRSAYLAQLAQRDAARAVGPGRTPAAQAALRDLDRLFADTPPGESTAAIRAARDAR